MRALARSMKADTPDALRAVFIVYAIPDPSDKCTLKPIFSILMLIFKVFGDRYAVTASNFV